MIGCGVAVCLKLALFKNGKRILFRAGGSRDNGSEGTNAGGPGAKGPRGARKVSDV